MILVVALHGEVVDNGVSLDIGRGSAIFHHDRRPVQVDAVVDDQQRIVVVDDIVVDTDAIQVLLEQVLEEEVFLLKGRLLLLNRQLVQVHLVVALVEVIQLLELVVCVRVDADNLFYDLVGLLLSIWVRLVERKHLFLLSLELAAEFGRLEDTLAEGLVATQCLHALQTVGDECAEMLLLVAPHLRHLLLQVVVMTDDSVPFAFESLVSIIVFALHLLGFQSKALGLLFDTVDVLGHASDVLCRLLVTTE